MPDLSFRSSLKPLEVEEIVDVLVHRPLAHVLARAAYPTRITPDQLTLLSMAIGLGAGAAAWSSFVAGRPRLVLAGALLVLSAVLDCADGQLARMRRSSSPYGRMLDGAVDAIVQLAVVPAVVAHVWWSHGGAAPAALRPEYTATVGGGALLWLGISALALVSGAAHTTLYDHFKNVYLHHTQPSRKEGDDPEEVDAAWDAARERGLQLLDWLRFGVYRSYLRSQGRLLRLADPAVPPRFRSMAPYDPAQAARYRALHRGVMRAWSFYGIGTHILALGILAALGRVELYILLRLVLANAGLLVLLPAQRRASRAFFHGPLAERAALAEQSPA